MDFADFLIGAPTNYSQGQGYPSYGRSRYIGLFAQDSWRVKSNLTLNYGLRWDVSRPWSEKIWPTGNPGSRPEIHKIPRLAYGMGFPRRSRNSQHPRSDPIRQFCSPHRTGIFPFIGQRLAEDADRRTRKDQRARGLGKVL